MALTLPLAMVITSAVGAIGMGAAAVISKSGSTPKAPAPIPVPTRNYALSQAMSGDSAFRRRQGAAATMVTGAGGAEAPSPGAKALLGQ